MERTQEEPLPSAEATDMVKLEDTRGKQGTNGIATEHAEEEYRNTLRELRFCIPRRQRVDGAGYVTCLCKSQGQSRYEKPCPVRQEDLERGNEPKQEHLTRDPFPWANLMTGSACIKHEIASPVT